MWLRETLTPLAFAATASLAAAQPHPCATGTPLTDRILEASVDVFVLQNNARRVSLAGIRIPDHRGARLPVPGASLALHNITEKPDRYGRHGAQVFADGIWVQGALLEQGVAIHDGAGPMDPCRSAMQAAEDRGRKAARGLWAGTGLAVPSDQPEAVSARGGLFSLIVGKVVSVGDRETRLYLNFGSKWSQDVTAVAQRKGRGAFKGSFSRLKALAGRTVLLRGVVGEGGGPLIRIIHDGQIVALD